MLYFLRNQAVIQNISGCFGKETLGEETFPIHTEGMWISNVRCTHFPEGPDQSVSHLLSQPYAILCIHEDTNWGRVSGVDKW